MVLILELTSPELALETRLILEGVNHVFPELPGRGGDIFNGGVWFERAYDDFCCWSRHLEMKLNLDIGQFVCERLDV